MGRTERELVEFDSQQPTLAVERLSDRLAAELGWVNLEPAIDDGREPGDRQLLSPFSGRGPQVPAATVVAGRSGGRKPQATSIGLTHPRGPRVVGSLAEAGIVIPESWILKQDHAKRGLVWEVDAATADAEQIVDVVLDAAFWLSGVELPTAWVAIVYYPER